jgi:trans-aconitate methyltransferase
MDCDKKNLFDKPNEYYSNPRDNMLQYIPTDIKRVVEFGCGYGSFACLVKEKYGCET